MGNHIMTAYLNLSNHQKVWQEYGQMKAFSIQPNEITMSILISAGDAENMNKGLNEVKMFLNANDYKRIDIGTLTGFYRKAMGAQDKELINLLKPICSKWLSPQNVVAEIKLGDGVIYFDNGYKEENEPILQKIDDLMGETGHMKKSNY